MRRVGAAFVLALFVGACSGAPGGQTAAPGATTAGQAATTAPNPTGGGGGAGILAAAQAAAANPCALMPMDLVAAIVPSAPPVTEALFPPTCSVFGPTVAIAFRIDPFSALEVPAGSEEVAGLSRKAYLEKLSAGNWTLWVPLTPDAGYLFAEVNNQDGKDHQQEVIDLAKGVLAKLGG